MIGVGTGLSLLPASTIVGSRASVAQTTPANITGDEFPIGVWWPPPPVSNDLGQDAALQKTIELYAEIVDAGFNFVIGGNGVSSHRANGLALDASAANNLSFLLTDGGPKTEGSLQYLIKTGSANVRSSAAEEEAPSIQQQLLEEAAPDSVSSASVGSADTTQEALTMRIEDLLEAFSTKDALAGFNLYDEPHKKLFERLKFARAEIQRLAPELLPYVNAWPSYASTTALGTKTYPEYLRALRASVESPVLSFDHYPLLAKGITPDYFYNWAVIRQYARRDPTVPSWGFIQSVGFNGSAVGLAKRRRPEEAEILWQVNVALAYGAKGLQYFTYWTPDDPNIAFGEALIDRKGDQTELYGYAQNVNGYLKKVGKVLLPLTSESVVHAKEKRLPRGAQAFKADKDNYVKSVGGNPVILSRFRESPELISAETDRYLIVANRSFANTATTRLSFSSTVSQVFQFDDQQGPEGGFVPVTLKSDPVPRSLPLSIEPGGSRLLRLHTG